MPLKTKHVFLTGGAQGLGKAYTDSLLAEGARVVFGDINAELGLVTEKEFEDKYGSGKVKFIPFDVTDKAQYESAFTSAVEYLGHVDFLVNNAGIMNESVWEKMILLNYMAVVRGTQLATEHMRKDKGGKGGRIINISSTLGFVDSYWSPVYCGTKNAVRAFTTSLASDPNLEEQGIEYGVLCPGMAATDLAMKLDTTKMRNFDLDRFAYLKDRNLASVEHVQQCFMKLALLDKLNGAVLKVSKDDCQFVKISVTELGGTWPAA